MSDFRLLRETGTDQARCFGEVRLRQWQPSMRRCGGQRSVDLCAPLLRAKLDLNRLASAGHLRAWQTLLDRNRGTCAGAIINVLYT